VSEDPVLKFTDSLFVYIQHHYIRVQRGGLQEVILLLISPEMPFTSFDPNKTGYFSQ
jgi:hypothetical protein